MTQTTHADLPVWSAFAAALSAFALGLRRNLANWPILMGRALFYLVAMSVLSALWDKVASQHTIGALAVPGGDLSIYIGTTEWITLSVASIHLRLEDDIRLGMLEPHLLRPKPYLLQKIAESLGDSLARLIGIGLAALLALVLSGRAAPTLGAFAAVAVLGPLGTTIGVLLYTIVGLCAFWVRRVMPAYLIMQKAMFLLGGLFAPITLYPVWLYHAGVVTPFAAHIFYAGHQMIAPSAQGFADAFAAQLFWIAALTGIIALIWRAGLRKVLREGV
jgi:ABC-2 type transport system permease protein